MCFHSVSDINDQLHFAMRPTKMTVKRKGVGKWKKKKKQKKNSDICRLHFENTFFQAERRRKKWISRLREIENDDLHQKHIPLEPALEWRINTTGDHRINRNHMLSEWKQSNRSNEKCKKRNETTNDVNFIQRRRWDCRLACDCLILSDARKL